MDGSLALYDAPRLVSNRYKTSAVRVVWYGRVSTQHEAQVNAFENQLDFYADILKKHPNWELVGHYSDKGVSGTLASKRPGFMKMIKDAQEGIFDLVITREVSRFARNTIDSLDYTRRLRSIGVEVYFINDNIWSLEGDGELRLTIMSALSQEESAKTSSRVLAGQHTSRQNGVLYGNGNILGYKLVRGLKSTDNTYEIVEDEAQTVRMIFEMYVYQNLGAKAIATEMQRLGRKNASGICKWDATRVLRILKNRTYAGYISYNKSYTTDFIEHKRKNIKDMSQYVYVKGNFPPIVSDELYNKAQAIRCKKVTYLDRSKTIGRPMSQEKWGSKLVCQCGSSFKKFVWRTNQKSGESFYGYTCWNIVNNKSKRFRITNGLDTEGYCNVNSICDWKLELMLKSILERLWKNPKDTVKVLVEEIAENYTEENAVEDIEKAKLLREKGRISSRLEALLDMRLDGSIDKESFESKHKQLKTRLEQVEEELRANVEVNIIETSQDVSGVVSRVRDVLETDCDLSQKKLSFNLVDSLIRRITPTEEGVYMWYIKSENDAVECTFKKEDYILYDKFVIDYETARAYRKQCGNYLRKNQYEELKVEVYVKS